MRPDDHGVPFAVALDLRDTAAPGAEGGRGRPPQLPATEEEGVFALQYVLEGAEEQAGAAAQEHRILLARHRCQA